MFLQKLPSLSVDKHQAIALLQLKPGSGTGEVFMNGKVKYRSGRDQSRETRGAHAAVIGGSMAGMLAARALCDHFERVTIFERDRLAERPEPRKGVPQARHLHVLMNRGLRVLNSFFPRLQDELMAHGALVIDMANDMTWLTPVGRGVNFQSDIAILGCSRDILEWCVRQQLTAMPQVQFVGGCNVGGLVPTRDRNGIGGLRLQRRDVGPAEQTIEADLIVDASGRGSRAPQWLKELDHEIPEEVVVDASLGYSSRVFCRPGRLPDGHYGVYIQPAPPENNRGGVLFPVEGNRWILTLAGYGGDYPPTDEDGFMDFMRSLRSSIIYDAVKDAAPLSEIHSYRATENRLRCYHELSRMPDGFVVLGDAVCAFNPVYAQGMTAAALSALMLSECLTEQRKRRRDGSLLGLSLRFQKKLAKVNSAPWMLATSEDFRVHNVTGCPASRITRFMQRYVDRVVALSTESAAVRDALLRVFNLLEGPQTLFHPQILVRVVGRVLKESMRRLTLSLTDWAATKMGRHGEQSRHATRSTMPPETP
jgi:2-polyprenyl-6-methoxyphenol hydroxylase-like FAD-dependent oxidoreductase